MTASHVCVEELAQDLHAVASPRLFLDLGWQSLSLLRTHEDREAGLVKEGRAFQLAKAGESSLEASLALCIEELSLEL